MQREGTIYSVFQPLRRRGCPLHPVSGGVESRSFTVYKKKYLEQSAAPGLVQYAMAIWTTLGEACLLAPVNYCARQCCAVSLSLFGREWKGEESNGRKHRRPPVAHPSGAGSPSPSPRLRSAALALINSRGTEHPRGTSLLQNLHHRGLGLDAHVLICCRYCFFDPVFIATLEPNRINPFMSL